MLSLFVNSQIFLDYIFTVAKCLIIDNYLTYIYLLKEKFCRYNNLIKCDEILFSTKIEEFCGSESNEAALVEKLIQCELVVDSLFGQQLQLPVYPIGRRGWDFRATGLSTGDNM